MNRRKNDPPGNTRAYFRSDRVFRVNGQWFFHTREGIDVGPFASEFEAQVEASILKGILKSSDPREAVATIRRFLADARSTAARPKAAAPATTGLAKRGRY